MTCLVAAAALAHDSGGKPHPAVKASRAAVSAPATPVSAPAVNRFEVGGPFGLIDHTGKPRTDESFHGTFALIFFGYASCDGICPIGLRRLVGALDTLGAAADRVQPVFITVDPRRDTVQRLAAYMPTLHPRMVGLTGSPERLTAAARAYGISVKDLGPSPAGKPTFAHGGYIYLMKPDGGFATLFPPVMPSDAIAAAVRRHAAAWDARARAGAR